jgi:hypothetical protein
LKSEKSSAETLASLVVSGGEILDFGTLSAADGKHVWFQMIQYKINIGDEVRYYFLMSCQYPTLVTPSKITGIKPDGTKGFIYQEDDDSNNWSVRNSDGSLLCSVVNGIKECNHLKKTSEDADWFYFKHVPCEAPIICEENRVSIRGGAIWTRFTSDPNWGVLNGTAPDYPKSIAE